tara:strand:+ start:93 stop:1229 length:1137 start_codon:yes stop_codon:yes gene_type:complete
MKKNQSYDEINLLEIYLTIINNKIKIILIIFLTIAVTFSLKIIGENKDKQSKLTTKIKAISIFEETQNYIDVGINISSENKDLNRYTLFALFVNAFDSKKKELIKNFNFIKRENYENEKAYEIALDQIVSSVKIITFEDIDDEGIIEITSPNENISNKWIEFLNTLEYSINKITQNYLKKIMIDKIKSAKIAQQNEIEDIERDIEGHLKNYELEIKNRISFLEEQAKIAREGNVESEKVTPSSFGSNYSINYNEDGLLSLYYLKGFRVIEKEIELINKRSDAYFFAKGIPSLESRKLKIESDQSIIRMETMFKKTPIFDDDNFSSGLIERPRIERINKNFNFSTKHLIILASLIGLIIGIFYVLISNAIRNVIIHNRK